MALAAVSIVLKPRSLAAHAATAVFASKLYSQSERKLNTIQSFLDLLTTTS